MRDYVTVVGELYGRRLPPFGKPLARALLAGRVPVNDVWLFAGTRAWEKEESAKRPKLILPPDEAPSAFRWPVRRCSVLISAVGDLPDHRALALIHALLTDGAEVVRVLRDNRLAVFRRGAA